MSYIKMLNINSLGYGNTFIHKLNPFNKFLMLIINLIIVFNIDSTNLLFYTVILIIFMLFICISLRDIIKLLLFLLVTMIGFLIMILLLNYNNKIYLLINIYFRILSMILPLVFYSLTTPLKQSVYIFEMMFSPLEYFNINTNSINLTLNIVLSYIPIILKEFDNVFLIKASKGEDIKEVRFLKKIKIVYDSLFVILVNSFIKANQMIEAILVRRFDFKQKRSKFIMYKFNKFDYLFLLILILILISFLIAININ